MVSRIRTCVLIVSTALLASSAFAEERPYKFPVKLEKTGFLGGFWDVGACYVSGQPTEEALRKLADEGVKTVICLRAQEEMDNRKDVPFDEAKLLKDLGVNYVHISMGTDEEYGPGTVKKFAEALDKAQGKVLLHCTVAWRASYVWGAYLNLHRKVDLDEVVKTGEAMNFSANRVALLLGGKVAYSIVDKPNTGEPVMPESKPGGTKLNLKAPVPIVAPDPKNFLAFTMWDMGDVLNSSQPDEQRLRDLAAEGVKTVVNIRTAQEMTGVKFDEEALVKSLGMTYVNMPIQQLDSFTPANLALIADAFEKSGGRTLLHCNTATRTSAVWIAYLVKYRGLSLEDAMKHGMAMRHSDILPKVLGKAVTFKIKD